MNAAIDTLLVARRPAWTIAIVRILFGVVLLGWTVTLAIDAEALLGPDAIVPARFATSGRWTPFTSTTSGGVWIALGALGGSAVAIIVGWRPTRWLVLAFLLLLSLQNRNPFVLNSGDLLLRNLALLLALTPTGAALSVDRWRRYGRVALRTAPDVAPWGLRLVQLQIVIVYFFAFWSKSGDLWHNGTAVSTAFRLEDLQRFAAPASLVDNVVVVALLTWGALAIELALALLLWAKRLRPVLIGLGIALHLLIDVFVLVGFFGALMIIGLLSFTDASWLDRWIGRRWPHGAGRDAVDARGGDADPDDVDRGSVRTMTT